MHCLRKVGKTFGGKAADFLRLLMQSRFQNWKCMKNHRIPDQAASRTNIYKRLYSFVRRPSSAGGTSDRTLSFGARPSVVSLLPGLHQGRHDINRGVLTSERPYLSQTNHFARSLFAMAPRLL
jgi:hypothetical protein